MEELKGFSKGKNPRTSRTAPTIVSSDENTDTIMIVVYIEQYNFKQI